MHAPALYATAQPVFEEHHCRTRSQALLVLGSHCRRLLAQWQLLALRCRVKEAANKPGSSSISEFYGASGFPWCLGVTLKPSSQVHCGCYFL